MNTYEDAPATKMLATKCACCGRPLLDSLSVETGMGGTCRSKHGFSGKHAPQVSDDNRKKANKIVYAIALGLPTDHLALAIGELRDMGFSLLASVLEDRKTAVVVKGHDISTLEVRFPFNEGAINTLKAKVPGRRWSRESKCWLVPATVESRVALWEVLKQFFHGEMIKTESGLMAIPIHNSR